jgi:hypothetical protein
LYRLQFEQYYGQAASGRAAADTALRLSLRLSTFPAVGLFAGSTITASLSIQKPAPAPLTITLTTQSGAASVDPSVTIPAGATSVNFNLKGVHEGVDEIHARTADTSYDTAESHVQILSGPDAARLFVVSSDPQSVILRLTDVNNLPYPGVPVQAGDSTVISDSDGRVTVSAGVEVRIGIP